MPYSISQFFHLLFVLNTPFYNGIQTWKGESKKTRCIKLKNRKGTTNWIIFISEEAPEVLHILAEHKTSGCEESSNLF